jgi:hypothetical protein
VPTIRPGRPSGDAAAALARHPDPILREIGTQLRDGHIRPRDVLSAPAYRAVLLRALDRLGQQAAPATTARGGR